MQIVAQDHNFTTGLTGSLVVQVWWQQTSREGLDALEQAIARVAELEPRYCILIVTSAAAAPPGAEARAAIAEIMKAGRNEVEGCALVFRGRGFGAAMVRAVVTGLTVLAGHPFPYRVFPELDSALAWLERVSGSGLLASDRTKLEALLSAPQA
jgi:hypothetical protein